MNPPDRTSLASVTRPAYDDGQSLALWDCDRDVEAVRDACGRPHDPPLKYRGVLGRLQVQMIQRRINVTIVPASSWAKCITLAKLDDLLTGSLDPREECSSAPPCTREQPNKLVVPDVDIDTEDDFMNLATTSTRRSSASPAPLSAGAD
jgi:hypothetical protein